MTEFEVKAVLFNLNRMFRNSHFSICEVRKMMEVTRASENSDFKILQMYHCTEFVDMDEETRNFIHKATLANVTNCHSFPRVDVCSRWKEPVFFKEDDRNFIARLVQKAERVN